MTTLITQDQICRLPLSTSQRMSASLHSQEELRNTIRNKATNLITSPFYKQSEKLNSILKYDEHSHLSVNTAKKIIKFTDRVPAALADKIFYVVNFKLKLGILPLGTITAHGLALIARLVTTVAIAAIELQVASVALTALVGAAATTYIWSPILNVYQYKKLKKIQEEIKRIENEKPKQKLPPPMPPELAPRARLEYEKMIAEWMNAPKNHQSKPGAQDLIIAASQRQDMSVNLFFDKLSKAITNPLSSKQKGRGGNFAKKILRFNDKKAAHVSKLVYHLFNNKLFYKGGLGAIGPLGKMISLTLAITARLVTFVALSALELAAATVMLGVASFAATALVVTIPIWSPILNIRLRKTIREQEKRLKDMVTDRTNQFEAFAVPRFRVNNKVLFNLSAPVK